MIYYAILFTVLIPILLLYWQTFVYEDSYAMWFLKSLANMSYFLILYHTANWPFFSYYLRYAYIIIFTVTLIYSLLRVFQLPVFKIPQGKKWLSNIPSILIIFIILPLVPNINQASQTPSDPVNLNFPLRNGDYYIAQGGSHSMFNGHLKVQDPNLENWRGQTWALDIVKLDPWGRRAKGIYPKNRSRFYIYEDSVYAPCSGIIVQVQNNLPDYDVPDRDTINKAGNHIVIKKGNQAYIVLAHLKRNSIAVKVGDIINNGDFLALIGNSGNTTEPHLHINAQRALGENTILDAEPRPILFEDQFLIRNDIVTITD